MTEKERKRLYYIKNKEKILARNRLWVQANKKENRKYIRFWQEQNPDKVLNNQLKHKFGITLEELRELKAGQKNKCAICCKKKKLVVDHCHKTGKVRGLLCSTCNSGIGMLQDNIEVLKTAIKYLRRTNVND